MNEPLRLIASARPTAGGEHYELELLWNRLVINQGDYEAQIDRPCFTRAKRMDGRRIVWFAGCVLLPLLAANLLPVVFRESFGIGSGRLPEIVEAWARGLLLASLASFPFLLPSVLVRRRTAVRLLYESEEAFDIEPQELEFWLDASESPGLEAIVEAAARRN